MVYFFVAYAVVLTSILIGFLISVVDTATGVVMATLLYGLSILIPIEAYLSNKQRIGAIKSLSQTKKKN